MTKKIVVAKSNELIHNSGYNIVITPRQEKLILLFISGINSMTDSSDKHYTISYDDIKKIVPFKKTSELEESLKRVGLVNFTFIYDKSETIIPSMFRQFTIDSKNRELSFYFNQDIVPFLFNLKKNYTKFELGSVLKLDSFFEIKLYEMMNRWHNYKKGYTVPLKRFKKEFDMKKEKDWRNIKKLLDKAVKTIGKSSDITFTYTTIIGNTKGSPVEKLHFKVKLKEKSKKRELSMADIYKQRGIEVDNS